MSYLYIVSSAQLIRYEENHGIVCSRKLYNLSCFVWQLKISTVECYCEICHCYNSVKLVTGCQKQ